MWIAAIFFICILALLAYLDTRKPKNYPPGTFLIPNWKQLRIEDVKFINFVILLPLLRILRALMVTDTRKYVNSEKITRPNRLLI